MLFGGTEDWWLLLMYRDYWFWCEWFISHSSKALVQLVKHTYISVHISHSFLHYMVRTFINSHVIRLVYSYIHTLEDLHMLIFPHYQISESYSPTLDRHNSLFLSINIPNLYDWCVWLTCSSCLAAYVVPNI